ncbi:MAG TPA: butyrate kinase, partial [Mesotoga sp.]|nr:butyrate kinase [Mesotoga sp.]
MKVLVINPGSTSTKIGVFEDSTLVLAESLKHVKREDSPHDKGVASRADEIRSFLAVKEISLEQFDAIACRGGILPPMESGTYRVNEEMCQYLVHSSKMDHPANLAAPIGMELSRGSIPVFITDPVSVDEFSPEARYSGLPQIPRVSLLHALNMKAAARQVAAEFGRDLENLNLVVVHLGGGISVGLQLRGKMVDVNNANDEGPFSPTRSGELPVGSVVEACFSSGLSEKELLSRYTKAGGMVAYLGTDDLRIAMEMARSDEKAREVIEAMAYGIAKEIGGMCTVAGGQIDAIVLTGGMAYNGSFVEMIKGYVSRFALVVIEPGENELMSLALGAERVLSGVEKAKEFHLEVVL